MINLKIIFGGIILLLVLFFSLNKKDDNLVVSFLNIGQGDAILIQMPQGENILIDGGEDNLLLSEVAKALPWWERKIDYIIISHYHADHITGLMELLNKYEVEHILTTNHRPVEDLLYQEWLVALARHNLKETIVQRGEKFILDDNLFWQVLLADDYHEDYNDNSLVVRLSFGKIDYLFMGDLSSEQEEKLINSPLIIDSEILKVGHHGSKYSSGEDFLAVIKPELCVIQSGEGNKFGHPHQEAIDRLQAVNCHIEYNQLSGLITVISDGQDWRLSPNK